MLSAVKDTISRHRLTQPGDRIGVAVSGGADSVALLFALSNLREELGVVLSVVHFHHGIRGAEADADLRFVSSLAKQFKLEFHSASGNAPALAKQKKESLETAARELRYEFFRQLIGQDKMEKIALAHTTDDQAETVLMRFLRGAGTRGLAGIYPQRNEDNAIFIRPLLEIRRADIESFLNARKQSWREDSSNQDTIHTRNRVRHELLPKLREFNPAIVENLAQTADVARAEEDYWQAETSRLLPLLLLPGKATRGGGRAVATNADQSLGLDLHALAAHPLALQRHLLRAAAGSLALELDIHHIESILRVANGETKSSELPTSWRVLRTHRELRFERAASKSAASAAYDLPAPIPGEVRIPDVNLLVHLHLVPLDGPPPAYNRATLHAPEVLCSEAGRLQPVAAAASLRIRSWREGDRFRQAHSAGEKKVKDLLQDLKVPRELRKQWPVVSSGDRILWVKGTRPLPLVFADRAGLQRLVIEARDATL